MILYIRGGGFDSRALIIFSVGLAEKRLEVRFLLEMWQLFSEPCRSAYLMLTGVSILAETTCEEVMLELRGV